MNGKNGFDKISINLENRWICRSGAVRISEIDKLCLCCRDY